MTGIRARSLSDVLARLPTARAALAYAERQHAGQRRSSDGAPFIEHPREVGWLLYRAGAPDDVVGAGLLHDILEKTSVDRGDLTRRFGSRVADLVCALTEDERIGGYGQRKAALREQVATAGPEALLIFAADKVSKIRELRMAAATASGRRDPVDESLFPRRRLAHFRHCLELLEEELGNTPLVKQLRIDLAGLNDELKVHPEVNAVA